MMSLTSSLLEFCRTLVCSMAIFCVKMDFTFLFLYTYNIKLSHGEDYKTRANTAGIKWWSDLFCYVCWWYYYTYPNDPIANSDSWRLHTCAALKTPFVFLKKKIYLFFWYLIIMKYNKLSKWLHWCYWTADMWLKFIKLQWVCYAY